MPSSTHRGLWFTSHGIVLAIGWFGGLVMLDRRSPGGVVNDPPAPPPASHAQVSAAWLEQALAKVREERGKSDSYGDRENLPVPELLKRNRREVAEQQAELTQRLDAIVSASGRYRDLTDPAAAIRDAMKNQSDEATDVALAVFHAWRERDPDAALACLAHTWPLLNDWDATPALLEQGDLDGFFNQFAAVDDQRIRDDLARQLGHALGGENPDDTTLAIILRLPAEYREAAAYGVSNGSMGYSDYPETRAALRNWIVNLMENGLKESARNNVRGLFAKDDPRVNDEIAAWIQTLPTEESWLPVTKELVAGWWAHDDAAMVRGLAALPPGAFRDALLADRAHHALLNPDHYQKPQLDRLLPLIENPQLREKYENWPWGDPFGEPRDDSMPDSDPFKDPELNPFAVPDK